MSPSDIDFLLDYSEEIQPPSSPSIMGNGLAWFERVEDPTVEAGVLSGMAHAALDFSAFFNPSRQMLRLFAVVGRLFVISADYLPDHSINQGELAIQLVLLSLTMKDLVKFAMKMRTPPPS
jgi:hypothetical protein